MSLKWKERVEQMELLLLKLLSLSARGSNIAWLRLASAWACPLGAGSLCRNLQHWKQGRVPRFEYLAPEEKQLPPAIGCDADLCQAC